MCYRHAAISFNRPCPHCGASQCNEQMFCTECGGLMPYEAPPSEGFLANEGESPSEDATAEDGIMPPQA